MKIRHQKKINLCVCVFFSRTDSTAKSQVNVLGGFKAWEKLPLNLDQLPYVPASTGESVHIFPTFSFYYLAPFPPLPHSIAQ